MGLNWPSYLAFFILPCCTSSRYDDNIKQALRKMRSESRKTSVWGG